MKAEKAKNQEHGQPAKNISPQSFEKNIYDTKYSKKFRESQERYRKF